MISHEFKAKVVRVADVDVYVPVDLILSYDPANDPMAVEMVIIIPDQDDVIWYLSRDLLVKGSQSKDLSIGEGDVKVKAVYQGVLLCLSNEDGHADILAPDDRVAAFLADAEEECPLGSEDSGVDKFLEEMFGV